MLAALYVARLPRESRLGDSGRIRSYPARGLALSAESESGSSVCAKRPAAGRRWAQFGRLSLERQVLRAPNDPKDRYQVPPMMLPATLTTRSAGDPPPSSGSGRSPAKSCWRGLDADAPELLIAFNDPEDL